MKPDEPTDPPNQGCPTGPHHFAFACASPRPDVCWEKARGGFPIPVYLTESLLALTDVPVTHLRWNLYKDSKLWMRKIKCMLDTSFPASIAKLESTHPTRFLPFLCLGSRLLPLLTYSTLLS